MRVRSAELPTQPKNRPAALDRLRLPLLGVGCLLVLVAPYLGVGGYAMRIVMLIGLLGLLTSGLNIVLGFAGELALGQMFLYAVGAYVAAYLGTSLGITDVAAVFLVVTAAMVLVGLISGIPGLRLGGWSLAMLTFFMVILIPNLLQLLEPWTGGTLGLSVPAPTLLGRELSTYGLYLLIVGTVMVWFTVARNLILSAHGNAFLVLRQSPILAASMGMSVFRLKLKVYVIGAVPCGLAGALFGWLDGYIAPDTFTFALSLSILVASIFGGATSIYGALLGAAFLQYGQENLEIFDEWKLVIYGVFLLVAALFFKNGIVGAFHQLVSKARVRGWLPAKAAPQHNPLVGSLALDPISGEPLECAGISKHFGGNQALREVSLTAQPGQITALIGPNGSGKTTLLNLMSGFYLPSAGEIRLGTRVITGLKSFKVAQVGVARTFQTPLVARGMTTREFVATGRYTDNKVSMAAAVLRLPAFRRAARGDEAEALRLLQLLGILAFAETEVSELPLGTRRLAEVARALAAKPRLFLFDEVASGLDHADLERLERAIRAVRDAGATVVLVEHNFPLVLKVSDSIHVLSRGELIATGTSEEIQNNARVLEEYTGAKGETLADVELELVHPDHHLADPAPGTDPEGQG